MDKWWEDPDFGTLEEGQVNEHPISRARLKKILYFPCGILTSLTGLVLFNIPLQGEESVPLAIDAESALFLLGMLLFFIGGPYLLAASIFGDGRINFFKKRKEWYEYEMLLEAIRMKPIIAHYWEAYRDHEHPHHNDIRRYRWMDAIKWRHRPLEVFGYMTITRESGEQRDGAIVPKSSIEYKLSNDLLRVSTDNKWQREEYVKGLNASPIDINLADRRVWGGFLAFFTISNLLFYVPATLLLALSGDELYSVRRSLITLAAQPVLLIFLAGVFTDLLGPFGHKWTTLGPMARHNMRVENMAKDMELEEIRERMAFLIEKYSTVRERLDPPMEVDHSHKRGATRYVLPIVSLFASLYAAVSVVGEGILEEYLGLNLASHPPLVGLIVFSLLLVGLFLLATLALRHTRFTMKNATFAGYRLTDTHLHLLDAMYGKKVRKADIPEHSCVRIIDGWDYHWARQNKIGEWEGGRTTRAGHNVVLHLIWIRDDSPIIKDVKDMLSLLWEYIRKPGLPSGLAGFNEIDLEGDGAKPWVGEYRIRFQFKTKGEQREFAERLASDLDLPIRKNWKWKTGRKYHNFRR